MERRELTASQQEKLERARAEYWKARERLIKVWPEVGNAWPETVPLDFLQPPPPWPSPQGEASKKKTGRSKRRNEAAKNQ